jgi:predicted nucleic acid-binding Zn ribbon protein
MSFNSLIKILESIERQPGWERQQEFRQLLRSWEEAIDAPIKLNARPLYIARKVLWVATSSSVWAQTLSLQRYTLLGKLNAKLSEQLVDIRFSPARWYEIERANSTSSSTERNHPSSIDNTFVESEDNSTESDTPQLAFKRWQERIQRRSQQLPLCPQCHCPTPEGELLRWQVCCHCAAKQWSSDT